MSLYDRDLVRLARAHTRRAQTEEERLWCYGGSPGTPAGDLAAQHWVRALEALIRWAHV